MDKLLTHIIADLRQNPALTAKDVDRIMRLHNGEAFAAAAENAPVRPFTKRTLMPHFLQVERENPELWAAWALSPEERRRVVGFLQVKPRRTQSGVATITIITRPQPCRGTCLFCPTEEQMPKSYLSNEPACQRAVQSRFDPYLQVSRRLKALTEMGHPTDKVELILLGGTWDDYPQQYRLWFVHEALRALTEFGTEEVADSPAEDAVGFADLFALQARNATAACRCVGLVVETRPDCIDEASLTFARALGCTKIQVGVQSLDEGVLAANGRPISLDCIARAFALLRRFGFKSHVHYMLNLLGSTPAADLAGYRALMDDPRFRPDEVKLYPCMLIRGAALVDAFENGDWLPYSHAELVDVLAGCLVATRPWTRVSRMIRDFSAVDILAGDRTANLRQEVEAEAQRRADAAGLRLQEMRSREVVRDQVDVDALALDEVSYPTATTREVFLQWVTPDNRLTGFLRLSLPTDGSAQAMIREVHVYGRVARVGADTQNAQHLGLGRQLVARAARLAREAGFSRLAVISAVGTRGYYEGLGFSPITAPDAADAASLYQYLDL